MSMRITIKPSVASGGTGAGVGLGAALVFRFTDHLQFRFDGLTPGVQRLERCLRGLGFARERRAPNRQNAGLQRVELGAHCKMMSLESFDALPRLPRTYSSDEPSNSMSACAGSSVRSDTPSPSGASTIITACV